MKDDRVYLEHILDCLEAITNYTCEGREMFLRDRKTHQATLRELQELAESAQRLSPSLRERHPEVPWREIAGFRNVLVHNYLGLNLSRVWEIIERDLPVLKRTMTAALKALETEE